ncbi:MAG: sirohydrochlorin cobaltochelatase [Lachnospiraceae bacterium]|nr:sirohydrochlorin cobaltochelatase [Lachnospiraceae bacterium]
MITGEGYEVECVLDGLGQIEAVANLYVQHTQEAIDGLGIEVDRSVAFGAVQPVESDTALLAVSFGTSYNDSRHITIGGIENALREAFPDMQLRRAFTAQIIIDILADRDQVVIDNVTEALDRAEADGIRHLIVQPTHLMNGFEYTDLKDELDKYNDKFDSIVLAEPLLTDTEDFDTVVKAITEKTAAYDDGKTAIVFMGHGTEAASNQVYSAMQEALQVAGKENYYVGTVEAEPTLDDVMAAMDGKGYERVILEPLMVVAGDHANNDMAGDEEDSWKTVLTGEGYEVVCLLDGLGQIYEIQQLYVAHTKAVAESKVADAGAYAGEEAVGFEGMEEITGDAIADGTYEIEVDSSSSMFKIVSCELEAKGGELIARMTMGGKGYLYVYPGTPEEAAAAAEADYIAFTENADGAHVYEFPVEALNKEVQCAAFSKNKEQWYERTLVFRGDTLPEGALK